MSWQKAQLEDLFSVGSSKRVLKSQWQNHGVPFYRGREVTKLATHGAVDNELFISEDLYADFAKKLGVPKAGDIVITAIGTIGNAYVVRSLDRFYFKDASVLWLSKKHDVESTFVHYWLQSPLFKRQLDKANGATVDTLTINKLKSVQIDLPPIHEQKRIVTILNETFEGITTAVANTEKNLANARELFESYLNAVFTQSHESWLEKPLGEFATSVSTGPFGSLLHKADYVSDGVPLVNPINIVGGTILPDNKKMISDDTKKRLQAYVLQTGDVVIARRGEVGRCAVITEAQTGWVCGTGCFFIRPGKTMDPNFLAHLLRSARYRGELERLSSGATMLNLSNMALSSLNVSMPDLAEQRDIVDQTSELFAQCQGVRSIYQQKLTALAELKQSLLQKAFSGEMTADKPAASRFLKAEEAA